MREFRASATTELSFSLVGVVYYFSFFERRGESVSSSLVGKGTMSLALESSRWMAVMAWGRARDIGFTAALELASSQAQILLPIFSICMFVSLI